MNNNNFEKDLQQLLSQFEPTPPPSVWRRISLQLRFPMSLSTWIVMGLLSIGLASFVLFGQQDYQVEEDENCPDRFIILIDTSYHSNGSFSIDTVWQDLPKIKEKPYSTVEGPIADLEPKLDFTAPEIQAQIDSLFQLDTASYKRGQRLFANYCATCHQMKIELTGPALADVTKKYEKEWLYNFTRESSKMIAEGDPLALKVWEDWQPTVMNNFTQLTDENLDDIYHYVDVISALD